MFSATAYSTRRFFPVDPIYVADFQTLRGITTNSMLCFISGYFSGGVSTVGAGWFIRDDNDTTSGDDGINTIVASNGKRWKRINEDLNVPMYTSYAALRLTSGMTSVIVYVTGTSTNAPDGTAGTFQLDTDDVTSADNGGTIIVNASGQRFKRQYEGLVKAEWFYSGAGNYDSAIQAAIDYAEGIRGSYVQLPVGDVPLGAQLNINDDNVTLFGAGQGGYSSGIVSTRNTSGTRLYWNGAASATTALVEFRTPAAGIIKNGGGLRNLMLDCMNLAGVGLRQVTWGSGHFEDVVVYGSTADGVHLTTTTDTLQAQPYDVYKNVFVNVMTIYTNLPTNNSNGLRLGRATGSPGTGNACYNRFYNCNFQKGETGGGYGVIFENSDNNMFFGGSTSEIILGSSDQGDGSGAARNNMFFGVEADVTAKASQVGGSSSHDNFFYGLNTTNGKGDVTVETGAGGAVDATIFVDWVDGRRLWPKSTVLNGAVVTSQEQDYSFKGTWTPSVQGGTTAGTVTPFSRTGEFYRTADRCFFSGFINYNTLTGTGNLRLTGLPFTAAAGLADYSITVRATNLTFTGQLTAAVMTGTTYIEFQQMTSGAAMTTVQVDAAASIHVSGSYPI